MDNNKNDMLSEQKDEPVDMSQLNAMERFYERFRGVSLKKLDIFIICCIVGIVLTIALGVLDSRGFF